MRYDIHNPTPAARVIYDGIPKDKEGSPQGVYHIPAGGKRSGVELSDSVADELIQRTKGEGKHEADLRLTPCVETRDLGAAQVAKNEAVPKTGEKPALGLKK